MKITFYRTNKINDEKVNGVIGDLTFDQLVFNFRTPTEVPITLDDLKKLKASINNEDRQKYLKLKDTGFFIGGEMDVESKSRKAIYLKNRTLLTFDIDYPKIDIWEKFKLTFKDIEAIKYSTISSSKEAPRYRILVPTSRPITKEEYTNLMSLIIKALDENSFDATTSDVARVMFLPAVCSDQEYVFEVVQGKPLEVDDILKGSLSENKIPSPASPINPKDKKGVVGAFNRAYSITNTIEKFLSEIYIKADNFTLEAPRYRFKGSTSTPGARVYDNDTRFYSAHDKDPARGLNLDAFNLVKVQLFANDFAKCSAWAFALPEVKKEIAIPNEDNAKWINNLYRDKRGVFLPSLYNVTAILDNDPHLNGTFKLNTLTYMIEVVDDLESEIRVENRKYRNLEDTDITEIQLYLETSSFNLRPTKQIVTDAVCRVAKANSYNPVRDYLENVADKWDGIPRVSTMFSDYLMVQDSPVIEAVARKIMAAAIWRIMKPGIKWEGVPVLQGIQGCGKSTFISKLYKSSVYDKAPKNWVNTTPIDYANIDKAIQRTKAFWGIELAELAATTMSHYSNELMKAFISMDRPVTRIPYAHFEVTLDRQCLFWGTTNQWFYISDQTGARRFLPLDCLAKTQEDKVTCLQKIYAMPVDQMWGEAMNFYQNEKLYFTKEEETELQTLRLMHTEESSYEAILSKFLETKLPTDWDKRTPLARRDYFQNDGDNQQNEDILVNRTFVTLSEICYEALGKPVTEINRKNLREIEMTLFNLGWRVATCPIQTIYGRSKTYIKSNNERKK